MLYDKDADLSRLDGRTIAVLGYGSQGHAHALNLKDSGVEVLVGLREGSSSVEKARGDGLEVLGIADAASRGDVVMVLLPDEKQAEVWESEISDGVAPGDLLLFAHGFSIHFGQIDPGPEVDVGMVAPKGPGHLVRRQFVEGKGVTELVRAGYETLVEAGYDPRLAYFECLHELKLIVDLMYEKGITGMRYSISNTAEYGDLTRGKRIIDGHVRAEMKKVLGEIQSGEFAREWIAENKAGQENFQRMREEAKNHQIEREGQELRAMMDWIDQEF